VTNCTIPVNSNILTAQLPTNISTLRLYTSPSSLRENSSFLLQTVYSEWPGGACVWGILKDLLQREISGLFHPLDSNNVGGAGGGAGGGGAERYLNTSNSNKNSDRSCRGHSSSGSHALSSHHPYNPNTTGGAEWTVARDVECLLFMVASLAENISEMPSPLYSAPSYSTLLPSLPTSSLYPLESTRLGPNTPHLLQPASSKVSTYRQSETENLESNHPCRTWFADIAAVTVQILEQRDEAKRDFTLGKYPAVGCRLLQLWLAIPTPPGRSSIHGVISPASLLITLPFYLSLSSPLSPLFSPLLPLPLHSSLFVPPSPFLPLHSSLFVPPSPFLPLRSSLSSKAIELVGNEHVCGVLLSVLRFACSTVERSPCDFVCGVAFDVLHALTRAHKCIIPGEIRT
jgi:hypothetical protein